jgi:hypothetical protein
MRKPSTTTYAPRGVVRNPIALRLLAPELAKHETLRSSMNPVPTSASFARQMYLRGVESFELNAAGPVAAIGNAAGVNAS